MQPAHSAVARRVLRTALATVVLVTLPSATAAATHTADHSLPAYGLNSLKSEWLAGYNSAEGLDGQGVADIQLMGSSNIRLYRARFRQDHALKAGEYTEWVMLDHLARQAALRGVTLLPVLINMPGEVYTPPTTEPERVEFARFAQAAARRYGPGGSFWQTCGCPARPVKAWEVWNEPNNAPYWQPQSPTQYGYLLWDVRSRLRSVDPSARIVFGGVAYLPTTARSQEPDSFIRQAMTAAGWNKADAVAVHPYDPDFRNAAAKVGQTVQMLKEGAGTTSDGAPVIQTWLTEAGRPTQADNPQTPADERAVSEGDQQAWTANFLYRIESMRSAWNIGPVIWYSLRDSKAPTSTWHRYGLRRTNSNDTDAGHKPAWNSYIYRSVNSDLLTLPPPR